MSGCLIQQNLTPNRTDFSYNTRLKYRTFVTRCSVSRLIHKSYIILLFSYGAAAQRGPRLLIHEVSRTHTTLHHSRYDSSGQVIDSWQRPLLDNTQQSQQTDIHASGWIRTHNLSRLEAVELRLRPRGHWDRP